MILIRKFVIAFLVFQSFGSYSQNESQNYDSMKYSFLPKYEIYGRYFNPFRINKTSYSFDFGFKWHRKKQAYFAANFIARGFSASNYYELISFCRMYRLTPPKLDWMHFELCYGGSLSHRYSVPPVYRQNSFGLGLTLRSEIQFDIGPVNNISLGLDLNPHVAYNVNSPLENFSAPKNGFSTPIFSEIPPLFYIGFNFYLK